MIPCKHGNVTGSVADIVTGNIAGLHERRQRVTAEQNL